MSTATHLADLADLGLSIVGERAARSPGFPLWTSIQRQLAFIRETVLAGRPPSIEEKQRITLGVLAAREFEDADPELADVLFNVADQFERL